MEYSTIKISTKTKEELDKLKIHPRQSYEEIIEYLLKKLKGGKK